MAKNPIGYHPSEKEKIAYLIQKVHGKSLSCDFNFISIPTIDIYGDKEPLKIFKDSENHFFSKKTANQSNIRIAGKGMWQMVEKSFNVIFDSRNREIGSSNTFKYRSPCNDQDDKWILKEYNVANKFKNCIKDDCTDFVFCSVTKSTNAAKEEENLDVESFFDQILASVSSSFNDQPQRPFDLNNPPA